MTAQLRLQRLILYHLWVCVPFAAGWMLWPGRLGVSRNPAEIRALYVVAAIALFYLVARTVLTFRNSCPAFWSYIWPPVEVALITSALLVKAAPTGSWLVLLYLLAVAEASAVLNVGWSLAVAGISIAGYLLAGGVAGLLNLHYAYASFRLFFLALMASLLVTMGRELARLSRERAVADYRSELAAEMHDGLQQYLSTITLRLELSRSMMESNPVEAAAMAAEQRHVARQAVDELRVMVNRLRETHDSGLVGCVRQCADLFRERCGARTEVTVVGSELSLPPRTEHELIRIVQEALNNCAKHSGATEVGVCLDFGPEKVTCTIQDNGCGFDVADAGADAQTGIGIGNMRSRAKALGGTCEIQSEPGKGTQVVVSVPVGKERRPWQ